MRYTRAAETVTYNDVLRDILSVPKTTLAPQTNGGGWTWKGVTLPNGTGLQGKFKSEIYSAKIENGKWMQDGVQRSSPSQAASEITKAEG